MVVGGSALEIYTEGAYVSQGTIWRSSPRRRERLTSRATYGGNRARRDLST